jgi:anti-anti-sigma factor
MIVSVALAPDPGRLTVEESEAPMYQLNDTISPVSVRDENESRVTITVIATVAIEGELDCSTEREVTRRIERLAESSDVIRIDARQVGFIDAAGVRTLLQAKRSALQNGATVTVEVASPGPVERMLHITGLRDCIV